MTEASQRQLQLTIDPQRFARIINSAVVTSCEVMNFHFNALSNADLKEAADAPEVMHKFTGPQLNEAERRALHENWILSRAFHELLRAVRHALEEAHISVSLLTKTHKIASNATLREFLSPFYRKASALSFPDLLEKVNECLSPKLEFAGSYKSMQIARNCLEHRAGIVSRIETHFREEFALSIPRLKLFYLRQGSEVEVVKGEVIEPGDDRAEVEILARLDIRPRSIPLGERIAFTLAEFNEVAFACHHLGTELSRKLPKPPIAGDKAG